MKKKQLAVWMMAVALSAAMMTGCGQKDTAEQTENTEQAENTEDQTAGSEEATMPDEDMEMDPEFGVDSEETSAAVFGVITDVGENEIIVDNQSGVSSEGEIILMIDPDHTYLLDASTGLPVDVKDVQAGDSFEAYLGDDHVPSAAEYTGYRICKCSGRHCHAGLRCGSGRPDRNERHLDTEGN